MIVKPQSLAADETKIILNDNTQDGRSEFDILQPVASNAGPDSAALEDKRDWQRQISSNDYAAVTSDKTETLVADECESSGIRESMPPPNPLLPKSIKV